MMCVIEVCLGGEVPGGALRACMATGRLEVRALEMAPVLFRVPLGAWSTCRQLGPEKFRKVARISDKINEERMICGRSAV